MKLTCGVLLATVLLSGCGPSNDNKPMLEPQRSVLNKAKQVDGALQQQTQQQQQEVDKQAQ